MNDDPKFESDEKKPVWVSSWLETFSAVLVGCIAGLIITLIVMGLVKIN